MLIDFSHRFAAEPLYYGYPVDAGTGRPLLQAGRHVMGGAERFTPTALALATPRCLAEHVAGLVGAIDPSHRTRGALLIQPALEPNDEGGVTLGKVVFQRVRLAPQDQADDRPGDVVYAESLAFHAGDIARGAPHLYGQVAERLTGAGLPITYNLDDVRRRAVVTATPAGPTTRELAQLSIPALRLLDAVSRGRRVLLGRPDCENEAAFLADAQAALALLPAEWRPLIAMSVGLSRPGCMIQWAFSEDCPPLDEMGGFEPEMDLTRLTTWLEHAHVRASTGPLGLPRGAASNGRALRAMLAGQDHAGDLEIDDALAVLDRLRRGGLIATWPKTSDPIAAIDRRLGDLVNGPGAWTPSMMRAFAADPVITERLVALRQGPEPAWDDWVEISLALASASPAVPSAEIAWMHRRLGPRDARAIGPARGEGPGVAVARSALAAAMAPKADPEFVAAAGAIAAYLAEAGRFDLVQRELHALVDRLGAVGSTAAEPLASIGAALSKARAMAPPAPSATPSPAGRLRLVQGN